MNIYIDGKPPSPWFHTRNWMQTPKIKYMDNIHEHKQTRVFIKHGASTLKFKGTVEHSGQADVFTLFNSAVY
jgi:hypothetical protein